MKKYIVKIDDYGNKFWYMNGERHREDGPALEWADGAKQWCLNGKLHREDGPAIEWENGDKEWWVNGVRFTEKQFNALTKKTAERPSTAKNFEIGSWEYQEHPPCTLICDHCNKTTEYVFTWRWKNLTDEEILDALGVFEAEEAVLRIARAVEAKLKEKNA